METETFDPNEMYRLDETIRSTMEAIRRNQMGGGFGGWFQGAGQQQQFGGGFGGFGGFGGGQNIDRVVETIRDRVV